MVTLPPQFTATKYPGYFWNIETRKLFSLKSGVLREMQFIKASYFTHHQEGYRVSVNGNRRWLTMSYLLSLTAQDSTIPIAVKDSGATVMPKPTHVSVNGCSQLSINF